VRFYRQVISNQLAVGFRQLKMTGSSEHTIYPVVINQDQFPLVCELLLCGLAFLDKFIESPGITNLNERF
jgi:hypothetical protein